MSWITLRKKAQARLRCKHGTMPWCILPMGRRTISSRHKEEVFPWKGCQEPAQAKLLQVLKLSAKCHHDALIIKGMDLLTGMGCFADLIARTKRHHDALIKGMDLFSDVGCFALTELGFGNNAVEMGTTATYDPSTQVSLLWLSDPGNSVSP
eukprot:1059372-Pelagomonas_calceolata.AAC.17